MKKLILPTLLLSAIITCDSSRPFSPDQKSFAFIIARTQSEKKCDAGECRVKVTTGSGSGIVIKSDSSSTLVITAGHVCKMPDGEKHLLAVVDSQGNIHESIESKQSDDPDLCIIRTSGEWGVPVPLSDVEPNYGERVISMAAPEGIFESNMVLVFEGRYSGQTSSGDKIFTIPCAPGSSGSAVLDKSGKIVSIIHSAAKNFQNIAIGNNLKEVRDFIEDFDRD